MKDNRYRVSGMSQNSGMGDRSVVMWLVMPSMRLEGTAPSATQRRRRPMVMSSERGGATLGAGACLCGPLGKGRPPFLIAVLFAAYETGAGAGVSPVSGGGGVSIGSGRGSCAGAVFHTRAAQTNTMITSTP